MRLTDKNEYGDYYFINGEITCPNEIATKIGKIEDIEDTLGIDLITLFKALKNGIFQNKVWQGDFPKLIKLDLNNECLFFEYMAFEDYYERVDFDFKDYGKTWALTKEELL